MAYFSGKNVKSFSSHKAHTAGLIFVSSALRQTQFTLQDHRYGASASSSVLLLVFIEPTHKLGKGG